MSVPYSTVNITWKTMQPTDEPGGNTRVQVVTLLLVTILVYVPVLFNFFVGDDFVHLSWLSKCSHDPSLLLRNFNHNWLDVITARFYRPLISVFMCLDYMIWRTNAVGFHITNLIFHVINVLLVFFISKILLVVKKRKPDPQQGSIEKAIGWPFLAALMFAIYPLHPEAVTWITGRVDTITTTFYLASFLTFIVWSITRGAPYLVLSLINAVLALLSKEMAITLPATMLVGNFWLSVGSVMPRQPWGRAFVEALKKTVFFWGILAVYVFVRGLSLGTFVGGYDNSILFGGDWHRLGTNLAQTLRMTFVPINKTIVGDKNLFTTIWRVCMVEAVSGFLFSVFNRSGRSLSLLLLLLTLITMLPVYKLLSIGNDLEGSRLMYLPSAFICMLIAFGFFELFRIIEAISMPWRTRMFVASLALWVVSGLYILYKNNTAWSNAGMECNAIRRQLEHLYDTTLPSDHLLLANLPDQINGAFVCRNVSPGILEAPQFTRPARDCLMLSSYDSVFPFGFLKKSLASVATEPSKGVKVFAWNTTSKDFVSVTGQSFSQTESQKSVDSATETRVNCWSTDFPYISDTAAARPENSESDKTDSLPPVVLEFNNSLTTRDSDNTVEASSFHVGGKPGVIFPLRAKPTWAFGGSSGRLSLLALSREHKPIAAKIESLSANNIMPTIDFDNSGYLGTKGFLHLSAAHPEAQLRCIENNVENADHFVVEILRPNVFLAIAEQNNTRESTQQYKKIVGPGKTGSVTLKLSELQGEGLYQARLWAVDKNGATLGVAGDHIIVAVYLIDP